MTNNRIVPLKSGRKSGLLAGGAATLAAEETIARHETKEALRAATFAYEQRLQALLADTAAKEQDMEIEYLAEMARILEG